MDIEELLSRFDSIIEDFYGKQREYTNELRSLFIDYNNGCPEYECCENMTIKLSESTIDQMKEIIENLRRQKKCEKNNQIQSSFREQQTGRSTYGPNNEYGK